MSTATCDCHQAIKSPLTSQSACHFCWIAMYVPMFQMRKRTTYTSPFIMQSILISKRAKLCSNWHRLRLLVKPPYYIWKANMICARKLWYISSVVRLTSDAYIKWFVAGMCPCLTPLREIIFGVPRFAGGTILIEPLVSVGLSERSICCQLLVYLDHILNAESVVYWKHWVFGSWRITTGDERQTVTGALSGYCQLCFAMGQLKYRHLICLRQAGLGF